MQRQRFLIGFAIALVFAVSRGAHGITALQVDTFQDGTSDHWTGGASPTNIGDGGPMGPDDAYLQFSSSGGSGPGSRLLTFNQAQWTGNYTAAGVAGVSIDLKNSGDASLPIRITIRESPGGQATPGYSSTTAFTLPADGLWHTAQFFLTAADLTAVNPFGQPLAPLSTVLTDVEDFRLLSATQPAIIGDSINAQIGIDNITALPPAPVIWTGASSTDWADSGNWTGPVPGDTMSTTNTDTATFSQSAPRSPLAIDAGRNLQNLTFDGASVNSLTIGSTAGPPLLLTAGGTIRTTSTLASAQTIYAPLVLEGDYSFISGASASSAPLGFGGGITPAATSGVTTLTLSGSNSGVNTIDGVLADNAAGRLALVKSGTGTWILAGANTHSGGTSITSGTLRTTAAGSLGSGPLSLGATTGVSSSLNLGNNQTVSSLTSTAAGGTVTINVAPGATLTSTGKLTVSGALNMTGDGTAEIDGAAMLAADSVLAVGGGTLRFNIVSGTPTVAAGASATIASGATLELAGAVSALSSSSGRVDIANDDATTAGLVVSGANQVVGSVTGIGNTLVNAGGGLTADHIIQNALVIGGAAGSPAIVTIDASDNLGNPLGAESSGSIMGGADSVSATDPSSSSGEFAGAQPSLDNVQAVPEPSSIVAALLGVACFGAAARLARARARISSSIVREVVGRPS